MSATTETRAEGQAAAAALAHAVAVAAGRATGLASPVDPESARALDPGHLRAELDRMLVERHADRGLDVLQTSGLLAVILPEIEAMVGFGDAEWRHKDVWKHTKQVVIQAIPTVPVRWSALLHDIGKVKTRRITEAGEVHFFGHAEVGASMFDRLCRRIPFEPDQKALVRFLILHHLRANQYDPSWTDSAVRRFDKEMGERLDDLLALSRADITTKRPERKKKGLQQIDDLKARIDALRLEDAKVPPLPKGLGEEIMKAFSIPAGRRIGDLRKRLEAAVDAGELSARQDAAYYVEWLRKTGIE
jgi:poly(A) polymerase